MAYTNNRQPSTACQSIWGRFDTIAKPVFLISLHSRHNMKVRALAHFSALGEQNFQAKQYCSF